MADTAGTALHQVQTGIEDVLAGYDTMMDRAEPEILPVILDLVSMHQRHASEVGTRLNGLGERSDDEGSMRGTVNQAAVTVRDWCPVSTRVPDLRSRWRGAAHEHLRRGIEGLVCRRGSRE